MTPIPVKPCTRELGRPKGTLEEDCSSLLISDVHDPIWGNTMVSAWMPDDEERAAIAAIAAGAPVMLIITGYSHPVVAVSVGSMAE